MSVPTEALLAQIQEPVLTKMLALSDKKRAGRDWPLRMSAIWMGPGGLVVVGASFCRSPWTGMASIY